MIKMVEKDDYKFLSFCDRDVFGTRIRAYFECYSTDYDFVKFFVQTDEHGEVTAAISRIDADITLSTTDKDLDEISEFLNVIGYSTIQCQRSIADKMKLNYNLWGYVILYNGNNNSHKEITIKQHFELKDIYDIIKSENLLGVGDYLPWLSDTSFRINRGVSEVSVAEVNGVNAGCAMILFKTENAALLGAVATVPQYRGMGIASTLVTSLADRMKLSGRRTELLCKNDSIVDFYKSIGFEVKNEWSIIYNEAEIF